MPDWTVIPIIVAVVAVPLLALLRMPRRGDVKKPRSFRRHGGNSSENEQ